MTASTPPASRLAGAWQRFWFTPESPRNLAVCRILFFGAVLLLFEARDFTGFAEVSGVFWEPIWFFRLFGLPQPSASTLQLVQTAWRVALAASCVGLRTRAATAVAFVLGTYLLGLLFCFGAYGHAKSIVVFVSGAMALSRCGDAFSVDSWIRARRGIPKPPPSGEYRWPIRLIWLSMTFVFFGAAVSKLRHGGLAWITSDTFALLMTQANYPLVRQADAPLTEWGLWIARHRWICRGLAAGSLAVELAFPLALVSRRMRMLVVPAALGMQLGISVVMGPNFNVFIMTYLFWIPWDRVLERFPAPRGWRSLAPAPIPPSGDVGTG